MIKMNNIYPINRNVVVKMVEQLKLKGYSESTISTYKVPYHYNYYFIAVVE